MAVTVIQLYGPTGTTTTGLSPSPLPTNVGNATLPANATPLAPPAWASILANRTMAAVTIQFICDGSASTAVTASVNIYVSNDAIHWDEYVTIAVSATTSASGVGPTDSITLQAPWRYIQSNLTAITGTSAVANVLIGVN